MQILEQTEPVKHGKTETENHAATVEGISRPARTDVLRSAGSGADRDDSDTPPREQTENSSTAPGAGRIVGEEAGENAEATAHSVSRFDGDRAVRIQKVSETETRGIGAGIETGDVGGIASDEIASGGDEPMWKERAEKAEAEVVVLRSDVANLRKMLNDYRGVQDPGPNGGGPVVLENDAAATADGVRNFSYDMDQIYSAMKTRAQNDPGILQLLASRPELRVQIETPVLEVEGNTLRGGLAHLIHKGFFSTPKNGNTTFNELQRLGKRTAKPNVYRELDNLAELGFLTKEPDGFQATDLKVSVKRGA
jgi:hypothetical protein